MGAYTVETLVSGAIVPVLHTGDAIGAGRMGATPRAVALIARAHVEIGRARRTGHARIAHAGHLVAAVLAGIELARIAVVYLTRTVEAEVRPVAEHTVVAAGEELVRMDAHTGVIALVRRALVAVVGARAAGDDAGVSGFVAVVGAVAAADTGVTGMSAARCARTAVGAVAEQPVVARRTVRQRAT